MTPVTRPRAQQPPTTDKLSHCCPKEIIRSSTRNLLPCSVHAYNDRLDNHRDLARRLVAEIAAAKSKTESRVVNQSITIYMIYLAGSSHGFEI